MKDAASVAIQNSNTDFQKGVAYYWLAHYYYDSRDSATAEVNLIKAIQFAPEFADSYSMLSANYNYKKDFVNGELYGKKCVS